MNIAHPHLEHGQVIELWYNDSVLPDLVLRCCSGPGDQENLPGLLWVEQFWGHDRTDQEHGPEVHFYPYPYHPHQNTFYAPKHLQQSFNIVDTSNILGKNVLSIKIPWNQNLGVVLSTKHCVRTLWKCLPITDWRDQNFDRKRNRDLFSDTKFSESKTTT